MQKHLILLLVSFISIVSVAQKKVITHDDYDRWMKMGETQLSEKGNIIVYNIDRKQIFVYFRYGKENCTM